MSLFFGFAVYLCKMEEFGTLKRSNKETERENEMNTDYIIVQAGGKGTRLAHLTKNKPKALVPVENLPMLFHLFRQFPEKKYIIIGDYHVDVLRRYLAAFAQVSYHLVETKERGTCAGLKKALHYVPSESSFLYVWSDLILPKNFTLPSEEGNYIGVSQTFPCRWSYEEGIFAETPSTAQGVAGLFLFSQKQILEDVPSSGEFVRWLSEKSLRFQELGLAGTREFGILKEYEALEQVVCRPFNEISIQGDRFVKKPLDAQGEDLAEKEKNWYRFAQEHKLQSIPTIHHFDPLTMEVLSGGAMHQQKDLSLVEKQGLLEKIIGNLKELHGIQGADGAAEVDYFSIKEAYFNKTMKRLSQVRDLIPFAEEKEIIINGKSCPNVFFHQRKLEQAVEAYLCQEFTLIHGDCTFSNTMLDGEGTPVFIDPRGYFGSTPLFGDPNYDWAKLYYSLVGNYDQFNLKSFSLNIGADSVDIQVESNQWEELEALFFQWSGSSPQEIKLLHSIIWLSLSTYAWENYDSICGAFYLGLYYLEEVIG